MFELGSIEHQIAKQAVRSGNPIPDRILNAPELQIGLDLYLQAFFDLDSERSNSNGLTSIPWSSIYQYACVFKFDEEQTADLFYFIKELDTQHLQKLSDKQKAAMKK